MFAYLCLQIYVLIFFLPISQSKSIIKIDQSIYLLPSRELTFITPLKMEKSLSPQKHVGWEGIMYTFQEGISNPPLN